MSNLFLILILGRIIKASQKVEGSLCLLLTNFQARRKVKRECAIILLQLVKHRNKATAKIVQSRKFHPKKVSRWIPSSLLFRYCLVSFLKIKWRRQRTMKKGKALLTRAGRPMERQIKRLKNMANRSLTTFLQVPTILHRGALARDLQPARVLDLIHVGFNPM